MVRIFATKISHVKVCFIDMLISSLRSQTPKFCCPYLLFLVLFSLRPTTESKWFDAVNFVVTQYTSYINERSKNFTDKECEAHFFPKDSKSTTEVDSDFDALKLFEFGALLAICLFMVVQLSDT